jgi:Flp pilus assembly secretin CpaC
VQFLDVGIVLRVTPSITADGRVLMEVSPEISTGKINETTGLPDKATTEVETTVMLHDGHGIVIGGLLQEGDADDQTKVPLVGDMRVVGRLFQRRTVNKERKEVIVALVPRIVPYEPCYQHQDAVDLERSSTRLVDPSLNRVDRPWEGQLPDAMRRPRSVAYRRLPDTVHNLSEPYPLPAKHYLPTPDEPNAYVPGGPYDPRVLGGSTIPHESLHPDEQYAPYP